jgi:hypothetical protein
MTSIKRLLVLAALALIALTAAASSATAATGVLIRAGRTIEQVSLGLVTFSGGATIECRLTLRGTLATALVAIGATIGEITNVTWETCRGGEVERVLNFNWPITVSKLNEAEPGSIAANSVTEGRLKIARTSFALRIFGGFVNCLYGGTTESAEARASLTHTAVGSREYTLGLLTIRETGSATEARFRKASGEGLCPASGTMRGRFEPARPTQTITFL